MRRVDATPVIAQSSTVGRVIARLSDQLHATYAFLTYWIFFALALKCHVRTEWLQLPELSLVMPVSLRLRDSLRHTIVGMR